jgi:signal transduction histidine kinase
MLLAFVPLYYATATYTRVALQKQQEAHAHALGRSIAAHVVEARERRSPTELVELLSAQLAVGDVDALAVYDAQGEPVARAGDPLLVQDLRVPPASSQRGDRRRDSVTALRGPSGPALAVFVKGRSGSVAAVVRVDSARTPAAPLIRLVGLYMAVIALGTLVGAYFALTRLIVRPVDALSASAERVVRGARELEVPGRAPRELRDLGASLRTMTSHLVREEEALRRKITEVEQATERLKAAQDTVVRSERLASVGRLSAGLAHEIGNPIAALLGLQDLLLEGGLDPAEQRDFLLRMKRETSRVHRILRDLLDFARPAALRTEPEAPGDVVAALADTLALVRPQKDLRDLRLVDEVRGLLPRVRLGHEQLVQLLLNLVMNAADACGERGTISVVLEPTPGGARIVVTDDGPGVAPEVRERLFEPFVTTKEVGKGTGLGLAVSRGLVEASGGSIELDANYTSGARFVIELPAAKTTAAGARA